MNKPFSILLQKTTDGASVYDSYKDFGIVATNFPFAACGEIKELASQDSSDEDGEDTYFPSELKMKAYDLEASLCYKGSLNTAYDKIKMFRDYLMGKGKTGTELKIYNSHTRIGRQGCWLKNMSDMEYFNRNGEDVLEFKITFRVTDPTTSIAPNDDIEPTKLVEE